MKQDYQPKITMTDNGTFQVDASELIKSPDVQKIFKSYEDFDVESTLEKSFRLMNEYLDNVSDEEFLKTYLEVEKECGSKGITIDEYLNGRYQNG